MRVQLLLVGMATLAVAGCVNPPDPAGAAKRFDFIRAGETTREALLLELGAPTSTFEAERISVWQFMLAGSQWRAIVHTPPESAVRLWPEYSLVVVFTPAGVVVRWRLVPLTQPAQPSREEP